MQPLFSIIIPTRNRSELLTSAVASALNQSFSNYEIIVSDNSEDPNVTIDALRSVPGWQNNSKCKYIRPTNYLHMPDHWDFATSHANGEYVAILTDRFVMRPSTLGVLSKIVSNSQTNSPDIVVWPMQSEFSEQTGIQHTADFTGKRNILSSREMLTDFAEFQHSFDGGFYFNKLPRGLNSLYKKSFALKIIERHGRLFYPSSPDYTAAFLFLAYSHNILYVDLPFYLSHGSKSNGENCLIYGIGLHTVDRKVDRFTDCPLPLDTVFNSIIRDFLFVRTLVYPRLQSIKMNLVGYYLTNYAEFIDKELMGSPMDMKILYEQWYRGVASLHDEQQNQIMSGIRILNKRKPSPPNCAKQKFVRKMGLIGLRDYYRNFQTKLAHQRRGGSTYENVIEAANATDNFLHRVPSATKDGVR